MSRSIVITWDDANWPDEIGSGMLEMVMDSVSAACTILGRTLPDAGELMASDEY